jgi:hypothetical protein
MKILYSEKGYGRAVKELMDGYRAIPSPRRRLEDDTPPRRHVDYKESPPASKPHTPDDDTMKRPPDWYEKGDSRLQVSLAIHYRVFPSLFMHILVL